MISFPEEDLNTSQIKFLESRAPYLGFIGGFGSGKSTAITYKALQLKGENGALPGLLMSETLGELFTNIVDPMTEILADALPRRLQPRIVSDNKGRKLMRFPDGCLIHLRSAKNISSYASLNVAWVCGDEIRLWQKKAYQFAIARARLRAPRVQRCFSTTPDMGYVYEEFGTGKAMHEEIHAGTRENAHNLSDDYIPGLQASYSPRMQQALLEGEWSILEGAVYEAFSPTPGKSPWIVDYEPTKEKLRTKPLVLAVDPGFRRSAWMWVVEEKPLEWIVFDELILDDTTDFAAVEMVNQRGWGPVDQIWVDPAADNTQSATGIDTLQVLRGIKARNQAPIRMLTDFSRDIVWGVDKTRVMLGGYQNLPIRLKFAKRLLGLETGRARGVIKDIASYRYPEVKDGRPVTDVPLKDGVVDHFCDAARYFCVGMVTTRPELRMLDPRLRNNAKQGWRMAA